MSATICSCNSPVKHLGLPNCDKNIGIPRRIIFVPTYQNDGTLNFIDTVSDAIDGATFWNGLQYNTEPTERYFPLPKDFKNVEMTKAESIFQEFNDGSKELVRDGVRSFMGLLPNTSPVLIGKLKSKGCSKMSVFIVDHEGNLVGIEKTEGKLYPMQLSDNTMNAIFQFASDTTVPMLEVKFEFAQNNKDELISYIKASDIGIDLFTQFSGKRDINVKQVGAGTATGFTVDIYEDYGDAKTKIPVENLVAADFALYNDTGAASISITSVTESPTVPGRYTFVVPTQTVTDDATLSLSTSEAAKPYDAASFADVVIGFD